MVGIEKISKFKYLRSRIETRILTEKTVFGKSAFPAN